MMSIGFGFGNEVSLMIFLFGISIFVRVKAFRKIGAGGLTARFFAACLFDFVIRSLCGVLSIFAIRKEGSFDDLNILVSFGVALLVGTYVSEKILNSVRDVEQAILQYKQLKNRSNSSQSNHQNIET